MSSRYKDQVSQLDCLLLLLLCVSQNRKSGGRSLLSLCTYCSFRAALDPSPAKKPNHKGPNVDPHTVFNSLERRPNRSATKTGWEKASRDSKSRPFLFRAYRVCMTIEHNHAFAPWSRNDPCASIVRYTNIQCFIPVPQASSAAKTL